MIGIIICGHGNFASGLNSSVKLLAGEVTDLTFVDFLAGMGQDELKEKIEEEINSLNHCSKVIILTDIVGGTPFKTSVIVSMEKKNILVISGTNLPLLLQLVISKDLSDDVDSLISNSIK
ncbi:MAG: PTS sugar transporter subunit IIA, partial [Erysipelotrichaceae bacterium]